MPQFNKGFTLIETLVASAVLMIFFSAVAVIIQTGIQAMGMSKLRSQATQIASERLELVQNLPYEDVGTLGGIPTGSLLANETVVVNDVTFSINTSVLYIDDPFDDLAPTDLLPVDYKRVRVSVTWTGLYASKQPLILLTDVAPRGIELADDQGTLLVLVINSQGKPVSDAVVHIEAEVTPVVDMEVNSDAQGRVIIPGAMICTSCYRISVSKGGYTSERTYGVNEIANPAKPHVSILEGSLSEVSFTIDLVSSLTLKITRDKIYSYSAFPGAQLILRGTKEIGRTDTDDPVYKVDRTVTAGTGGLVTISDLEWDNYTLAPPNGSTIDLAGTWPFIPIGVLPDTALSAIAVVKSASANSLWVQMVDEQRLPLASASLELSYGGQVATVSAGQAPYGDWSQAFFSSLNVASYDLTISADGLATVSSTLSIEGDVLEYFVLSTPSATPIL